MRVLGVSGSKRGELELILKKYWLSAIGGAIKGIPLSPGEFIYICICIG